MGSMPLKEETQHTLPPLIRRAGFWRRMAASILDFVPPVIIQWMFLYLGFPKSKMFLSLFFLCLAYETVFEVCSVQATPAKVLFGLHLTNSYGKSLTALQVLIRNTIKYLFILPGLFFSWGYMVPFLLLDNLFVFGRTMQPLHDKAAKAIVTDNVIIFRLKPSDTYAWPPLNTAGIQCVSGYYAGKFFPLLESKIVMGRSVQNCNIVFPDRTRGVSAIHCELMWDKSSQSIVLRDLGSTYGTVLDHGTRIKDGQMAVLRAEHGFTIGEDNRFIVKM